MAFAIERQRRPEPKRFEVLHDPILSALRGTLEGIQIGRGQAVGESGSRGDQHAIEVGDGDAGRLQLPLYLEDE